VKRGHHTGEQLVGRVFTAGHHLQQGELPATLLPPDYDHRGPGSRSALLHYIHGVSDPPEDRQHAKSMISRADDPYHRLRLQLNLRKHRIDLIEPRNVSTRPEALCCANVAPPAVCRLVE
jgi:hypothetical protein